MKAVFAGSFDPPTLGHIDIIRRASPIFAELRVVVGHNIQKQPLLSLERRMDMLRRLVEADGLSNVTIDSWHGLIAEYAGAQGCGVLVRSVRSMADIPYEQTMSSFNRRMKDGLETLIMFSRPEFADISSSTVRELLAWKRLPRSIVPDLVQKELELTFGPLLQS
ncbi:MAG: pantetheine-phosphate adenylyltransferase [Spirochaetae bacterium HGW-Spirochaetae-9]|nr:MAG: pantetheine-phosphate adenylyltransferase [Spirochaetae bacterium HGW-Spirochaetae-9]